MSEFMGGLTTRIEGYRRRAEDARSKAENTRFGKTKASWLQLARLWDELADQLQPLAPTAETDAPQKDASTVSEREADGDENDKGTDWPACLLADSRRAGAGCYPAVGPHKLLFAF